MMSATTNKSSSEQTRARLLEAAREVFSQHGFQGATVREICRRADANGAAVNYHFGSKDSLIAEALSFSPLKTMLEAGASIAECPSMRLRLFVHDFMQMLLDESNPTSQCQIMARELADPTPALDKIVQEAIAPMHEFLGKLVREIVGDKISEKQLLYFVCGIFGQCLYYRHSQPVLQRLHPNLHYGHQEIEAIAEHITEFSLAGIKHLVVNRA